MQISVWVPYDEQQLRRSVRFILRPQLKLIRIWGVVVAVAGLLSLALDPSRPLSYGILVAGVLVVAVFPPIMTAQSMRVQPDLLRDDCQLTLDDECVGVRFPLAESRFRWAATERVVETPEVWFVMFSKIHVVTIPKQPLTEQQLATVTTFLNQLRPTAGGKRPARA